MKIPTSVKVLASGSNATKCLLVPVPVFAGAVARYSTVAAVYSRPTETHTFVVVGVRVKIRSNCTNIHANITCIRIVDPQILHIAEHVTHDDLAFANSKLRYICINKPRDSLIANRSLVSNLVNTAYQRNPKVHVQVPKPPLRSAESLSFQKWCRGHRSSCYPASVPCQTISRPAERSTSISASPDDAPTTP